MVKDRILKLQIKAHIILICFKSFIMRPHIFTHKKGQHFVNLNGTTYISAKKVLLFTPLYVVAHKSAYISAQKAQMKTYLITGTGPYLHNIFNCSKQIELFTRLQCFLCLKYPTLFN